MTAERAKGTKLRALRDILIVVGGIGAGAFVWSSWQADSQAGPSAAAQADLARTACRTRISEQLRDPASAEWNLRGWPVTASGEGRFRVEPDLRARNALGGMVRSRWVCDVQVDGTTRRVLRLEEL